MRKKTFTRIMLQRQTDSLWLEADRYEEVDPKRRFKMLRRLIRLGHNDPGLFKNLAYVYAEGIGVKRSRLQAQRWNRKAWRRGIASAACNAGIDARLDGHYARAIIWFRRAIDMGDSDALLHLAKLLRTAPGWGAEVLSLLRRRVSLGAEKIFEIGPPGEISRPVEDEDFIEAKQLLRELESQR